jgi:hypothetical protein
MDIDTRNPKSGMAVSYNLITIDVDDFVNYSNSITYGDIGSTVSDDEGNTVYFKLNHRVVDDNYRFESASNDDNGDVDCYDRISSIVSSKDIHNYREIEIGEGVTSNNVTTYSITGGTNEDNLMSSSGNEFRYNAGNVAPSYSDEDLVTVYTKKVKKDDKSDDTETHYYYLDNDGKEVDMGLTNTLTDAYNTSNSLDTALEKKKVLKIRDLTET